MLILEKKFISEKYIKNYQKKYMKQRKENKKMFIYNNKQIFLSC